MQKKIILPKFLKSIFWDVELKNIDPIHHQNFLITRIAEKGRLEDVLWLRKQFSSAVIQKVLNKSKNITAKTRNFWNLISK